MVFINGKTSDSHHTDLFEIDVNGGEARKLCAIPLKIEEILVLNDRYYLARAAIDVTCPDYHALSEADKAARRAFEEENADYQVLDEYPYCFNGAGFINHRRSQLFLISRETFDVTAICPPYTDVETFDLSPDGQQILYSAQIYTTFKGKWSQVYRYDAASGRTDTLYDGTTMQIQRVFWYEGKPIVAGTFAETFGAMENSKFYRLKDNAMSLWIDFDGGLFPSVGSDCRYGHGKSFYSDHGKPYFISADNSAVCLYTIEHDAMVKIIGEEGTIDDFAIGADGILVIGMYASGFRDLRSQGWLIDAKSALNEAVLQDRYVAKPKRVI